MALVLEVEATANTLVELVIQIDIQLAKIDEALGKLQPWKSGKLRIQWWKKRGKLVPSVVKWIYGRTGLWRAERVKLESLVLVVKTSHEWRADSPVVKDLMRMSKTLLVLRARALGKIQNFKMTEALSTSNQVELVAMNANLDGLLQALENRTDSPDSEPGRSSAVLLEMLPEDD
ncbi:hypothetical protein KTQ42_23045 [Noviherbaspirillum sp. L7-7A]|uniref:hypothetical protein n=1 Tax=Noviherbaspirillum sp. L7-7A TaxID=2850560 RepID=UPI001C2B79F7|nr:hypothetical protein [Noviherbaspirillum sp. L7-7A]MBV0882157.1 hypothetical protein [Noviherbaspirillum sp. L7-7A]